MRAPYPVLTVARWFIAWAGEEADTDLSNLKLQKVLYYAQGHHLARFGTPVFNEAVDAWAHGPVVKTAYHAFKDFEGAAIQFDGEYDWDQIDPETTQFLIEVWATYGALAAWKLREMTHAEPPWQMAFDGSPDKEIPQAVLADYFRSRE
jgi:uncharacterized phage-associated protein